MATVVTREFYDVDQDSTFEIVPLGDIHIGAAACDEKLLKEVVSYIESRPNCYWIGMGDYCDFINRSDPRFDVGTLAEWVGIADLADLAQAQREHFLDYVRPIAGKCLGLVAGNHEGSIRKHYERDIFLEIVQDIKHNGNFKPDHRLAIGYYGYLVVKFYRNKAGDTKDSTRSVVMNLHHGFAGGRLAGGKALAMQRWIWTHEADVFLMGHSHNTMIMREAVEYIDRTGRLRQKNRIGAFTGTFLKSNTEKGTTYSEIKGYLPLPIDGVKLRVAPYPECSVRIAT